jgi:glycosyltransferase involved in cell wall biosynthesis
MKIAMIIEAREPMWWWWQTVAHNLSRYISKKKNSHVDLYVMNIKGNDRNYIEKVNNKFNIIYVWKKRTFWFIDRVLWIFDLIKIIRENHQKEKYNLIYAHANLPWIPAKILSKRLNIPSIYHVHGSWVEAMKKMYWNNLKSKILFFIEDYIQTRIKYDIQITVDKLFLLRRNINSPIFIPNWVETNKFKNTANIHKENKNWINFIFVWRLHPQKWLIYLIKAINLIKKILKNNKLIIIWEWKEEKILKQAIQKYWIEKYFEFRWRKQWVELINEYHKADVFILPSLFEWFPLTLLEALVSWLPALVTDVWENKNIVREWTNWRVVKAWHHKELAEAIRRIICLNKKDLIFFWKNWKKLVTKEYNLNNINEEIFDKINLLYDNSK